MYDSSMPKVATTARPAITRSDHKRAAYAQLTMVADAWDAPAPEANESWADLRQALVDKLRAAWGPDGFRRTYLVIENVNQAFLHASVRILDTEEVKHVWPYWGLFAVMDQRTSRICLALDKTVRPAGEAWWYAGHIPPLHFGGCRTLIEGLTLKEAHKVGVTPYWPIIEAQHGFGYIDREWEPDLSKFPPELMAIYSKAMEEAASLIEEPPPAPASVEDEDDAEAVAELVAWLLAS